MTTSLDENRLLFKPLQVLCTIQIDFNCFRKLSSRGVDSFVLQSPDMAPGDNETNWKKRPQP